MRSSASTITMCRGDAMYWLTNVNPILFVIRAMAFVPISDQMLTPHWPHFKGCAYYSRITGVAVRGTKFTDRVLTPSIDRVATRRPESGLKLIS